MTNFDEQLKQRLLAFQRAHGLDETGIAGSDTWTKLAETAAGGGAQAQLVGQVGPTVPGGGASPGGVPGTGAFPKIPGEGFGAGFRAASASGRVVAGGTQLGEGAFAAAESGAVVTGATTTVAEGTVVVGGTTVAQGTIVSGGTIVKPPVPPPVGGLAAAGLVVVGALVVAGTIYFIVDGLSRQHGEPGPGEEYRGTSLPGGAPPPAVAPGANPPEPAQAPGTPQAPAKTPGANPATPATAPGQSPGGQTNRVPASLPGPSTGVPQLQASSADVESARSRLDQLQRSGSLFRDTGDLRDRLGAADESVRRAAQAELAGLEREVADFERLRRGENIPTPQSVPLTRESAFEELMHRYPSPLNQPPYNRWSRDKYTPIRLQQEDLSRESGESKRILVIRAPNGDQLRFSVIWRNGEFLDIHESSGPSDRQQ